MTHHPVETHGRASLPLFCHTYMLMLRSRFDANNPKLPSWEGLGVGGEARESLHDEPTPNSPLGRGWG